MLHRRSIFLIDRKFQLRFAFYVCSWLIALSFAYPLIISNLFEYFIRYLAYDPMGPEIVTLHKTREELLWLLVLMQIIFLSLTFFISIFMSHRIAGPLFKLRRFFEEAKSGKLNPNLTFRKTDYFHDLAKSYNEMMESIELKQNRLSEAVSIAIPQVEKALSHPKLENRQELENALSVLKESLEN